jgi:hypothetical protein
MVGALREIILLHRIIRNALSGFDSVFGGAL